MEIQVPLYPFLALFLLSPIARADEGADRKLSQPGWALDQPQDKHDGVSDDDALSWSGGFAWTAWWETAWGVVRPGLSWHWDPFLRQIRYRDAAIGIGWGFSPQILPWGSSSPLSDSPFTEEGGDTDFSLTVTVPFVLDVSYRQPVGDHFLVPRLGPSFVAHREFGSALVRDFEDTENSFAVTRQSTGAFYYHIPLYLGLDFRAQSGFLIRLQSFLGAEQSILIGLGRTSE